MNKSASGLLTVASVLIGIGLIIFITVMSYYKWDFSKLSTVKYQTESYELSESFTDISINTETTDIYFIKSTDGKNRVECYEHQKEKHSVEVINGVLTVGVTDEREWYDYIAINFNVAKVKIYLNSDEYQSLTINEDTGKVEVNSGFVFTNVNIKASTGDINFYASVTKNANLNVTTGDIDVSNASFNDLNVSVSTGDIEVLNSNCYGNLYVEVSTGDCELKSVTCKNLTSIGTTGDIDLKSVIASENFNIERSTGDVSFSSSDANQIFIETSTGDVEGTLLSGKNFVAQSSTGRIKVPTNSTGGRCQIKTDTGDIKIYLVN